MGHLLASVNPEATERIENPSFDAPDVGIVVVYRARKGVMRMGRTEFPALVLGHDEDGFLELLVMMEPEDMMLESHVRPWVEGNEDHGHCYRMPDSEIGDVDHRLEEAQDKVAALVLEIAELKETLEAQSAKLAAMGNLSGEIAAVKQLILGSDSGGEYKPAKLSVYDLLAEFEGKLKGNKRK